MFRTEGFIILGILLLSFTLTISSLDPNDNEDSGETSDSEDHITLLNNEKEYEDEERQKPYSSQDFADEDIDRMPHVKESTIPPVSNIGHILEEFTPEVEDKTLDAVTKSHLNTALNVLGSARTSDYTVYDIRAAFLDLESAAEAGSMEAQKVLAFAYLFGEHRWSIDEAKVLFEKLVAKGSTDGHLGMALLHLTGVTMKRPNRPLGLLHLQFAANGGNPLAQMAIGYRYQGGIDMKTNCEKALSWYKIVARKVASKVTFLGGASVQRLRIPDEIDSSSSNIMDTNVFTYYRYLAENGDIPAILGLATLHLTGSKGVEIDYKAAAKYFGIAADSGNAQAFAYLGKMYYDGTVATPRDDGLAYKYFKKAADKGNSLGQTGLGLMYLEGRGIRADHIKAFRMFSAAAEQGSVEGQFYLGYMHYKGFGNVRDHKTAAKYFQLASQSGNLLAIYNLAQMHSAGIGVTRSCQIAVELYKTVAERGRWTEKFMEAYNKYQRGAVDEAAFNYMLLGELGYEIAQTNFAHIVEENSKSQQLFHTEVEAFKWSLLSWQRSANQQYPFARVKLGDFNYYGLGTHTDYPTALNHYKIAADNHHSAQAMFNLGYMHEQGLGLDKDLHLAKRYYDLAAETSVDAVVPVALAMLKLRAIFFLDYMKDNFAWHSALIVFLDSTLGPKWDFFVMSVLLAIIPYLLLQYWQNRRQIAAQVPVDHVPVPPAAE
uniref:Uncharacterized protein n=1 Tax=Panagrolaimus superbus TaxID=310955 RepID=A0A914YZJ4_9BILA